MSHQYNLPCQISTFATVIGVGMAEHAKLHGTADVGAIVWINTQGGDVIHVSLCSHLVHRLLLLSSESILND